ncbi:class I adenylate-forming enzyme family protein [Persicimonas caeni]|nr:class I adenylate-forming enzyme family protein [Persicimonas caeni]
MSTHLTLGELFAASVAERGEHSFVVASAESVSYSDFAERAARVAGGLSAHGVEPGDRVAVMLPNSLEWLECFFAAAHLGAVAVPINPTYKYDEVDRILADSEAVVLVTDTEHAAMAEGLFEERLTVRRVFLTGGSDIDSLDCFDQLRDSPKAPRVEAAADTPLSLTYTSGTSGNPRGVLLSSSNYAYAAQTVAGTVGLHTDDRLMCALPFCHVASQVLGPLGALAAGATLLVPGAQPLQKLVRAVESSQATALAAVPNFFERLTRAEGLDDADLDGLRLAVATGAPISPEAHSAFEDRFELPLITSYGLTEACGVSTINVDGPDGRRLGSVGRPLSGQELQVVDDDDLQRRTGAAGELVLRGPNVMLGYLDEDAATADALRSGWLHTGDIGFVDDDGFVHLVGRKKELIVRGGDHVYPREVEDVLRRHPAVAEAAVIGVADQAQGEEVAAFIVVEPGHTLSAGEAISFCRDHLANYKCPGIVEFRDALPMTPTGRVRKAFLAQIYVS